MATGDTATQLQQAIVAAMKARDRDRLSVLRMLQAAVKQVEVDERQQLDDAGVVKVLSSYARKVKDQIAASRDGGRDDLLTRAEKELAIVNEFMPAELTDAELVALIDAAIAEVGATGPRDMGQVMKAVLAKVAGRADGKRVSSLVKQKLSG